MPSRIVREGILTSERIDLLSWQAEVLYRRLMSVVDDYGRYYSRPALIRAACFPLRLDRVSDSDIGKWLRETEKAGLVRAYQVESKGYLELLDFNQQVRAKESRFPNPPVVCIAPATHPPNTCAASVHLDVDVDVDEFVNTLSTSVDRKDEKPSVKKGLNGHGTRLPDDWSLPDDLRDWAVKVHGLDPQKAVRLSLAFRDYWHAKPGKDGRKADWSATWRNWVRKDVGDA